MRRLFRLILLLTAIGLNATAQSINPDDYIYPIRDVAGLYSANFGEMRPGHFHAGIDIKTEGVVGKPLVAVMDGYISRVVVQAGGYGRAVYIALKNGTTVVYGHLQRFTDPMERHIRNERYRRSSNSVDLWFTPEQFPVRQGDHVGYSGNSGTSSGPHLHFELRNSSDQSLRNPVREGIIHPIDTLPPRFMKLHYVEIDTLSNGIPMRTPRESYDVVRTASGDYRLTRNEPLPVGRKGYFIAEVTDRRNGVQNVFAVYRLKGWLDGIPYFEFRLDTFTFAVSRTCDAVSCYPLQLTSRNEVIRMAQLEGAPDLFYPVMVERGLIRTTPDQQRTVEIEIEDDCGNTSSLRFRIVGREETFTALPPADEEAVPMRTNYAATLRAGKDFSAHIPKGALYDGLYVKAEAGIVPPVDSGTVVLTPAYRIFTDPCTPLFKPISVTLCAHVPPELRTKTVMALRNRNGRAASAGGRYKDGEVTISTRSVGDWFLAADTLSPTIRPQFKAADNLNAIGELRFRVGDNFTGIASWRLEIDGEWVPCDRYPSRGLLVWHIDRKADGGTHRAVLTVRDGVGNTQRWEGSFRW